MSEFRQKLAAVLDEESIKTGELMKKHTTFRIGGPAKYFLTPKTEDQLCGTVKLCMEESMPYYIIGNGSNLLVSDEGYDGAVVSTENLTSCRVDGENIYAGAGILLSKLAKKAAEHGLTGLEFAAGIPGTLGGAAVMNGGAYGREMKDVLADVTVLTPKGEKEVLSAEQLELGYRTSCIPERGYIVLGASLKLKYGMASEIYARMEELAVQRKTKQPLEYPSAGSTFKRPAGYFAGKLIDEAGLRGFAVGGAQVSEKHCGFVINRGQASAKDVLELCEEVKRRVREKFGVELEMEVKRL